jgi:hypothetical protein
VRAPIITVARPSTPLGDSSMKACPLCKEPIAEDAIKCPHCRSFLVPLAAEEARPVDKNKNDGGVVYVVDKGLVRFGKFVAGALAVLTVLGAYGFGLDVKESLNGLRTSQEKAQALEDKIRTLQDELEQERKTIQSSRDTLAAEVEHARLTAQKLQGEAEAAIDSVREMTTRAKSESQKYDILVAKFTTTLSGQQQTVLAKIKENEPDKFRESPTADRDRFRSKLWRVGTTLRVRFLGGEPELRARVAKVADEWSRYANVHFEFDSSAPDAEVRVSFRRDLGDYSYLGTDALAVSSGMATVNLGSATLQMPDSDFADIVLRQFGHVLGLLNEISNPNRKAEIDMAFVTKFYAPDLPKELIENQFGKATNVASYREFDPQSVMMDKLPKEFFSDGGIPEKTQSGLSKSDKEFIRTLYPFN